MRIGNQNYQTNIREHLSNATRYLISCRPTAVNLSWAVNYGFDITPARLITGLITEKGICRATEKDIKEMFSDKFN